MTRAVPVAMRVTPQLAASGAWLVAPDGVSVPDEDGYQEWEMARKFPTGVQYPPEVHERLRELLAYHDRTMQPAESRERTMLVLMDEFEIGNNNALGLVNWERRRQEK